MKILQLTAHYKPNVGGVETHLNDLVEELVRRGNKVFVLTYRPLITQSKWKIYEKEGSLEVLRLPWFPGLFYSLVKSPLAEFIYLTPFLFFTTPLILLIKQPEVIHSHGLIAGFSGVFWGKVFRKRVITTTHSIYHFPKNGLYRNFVKWIFKNSDIVLTLSKQSKTEIEDLGIDSNKVKVFTYWIDLKKFKLASKDQRNKERGKLGWKNKFVVLFVGRLVEEKGILVLLESAKTWSRNITLVIIGTGPLEKEITNSGEQITNLQYLGKVENDKLPLYYCAADILIVPSTHEEGFGRVILESLACGTPVIAANRGAIPEAMDNTVGKLIDITPKNITGEVERFFRDRLKLKRLAGNAREFALKRYSNKNINLILDAYKK